MAWLCCTVVPQRECLWLRWGLLALQTSNIFSCVAWRGAVICLVHWQNNSVFMIQCFSYYPATANQRHICTFLFSLVQARAESWWAEDAIHLVSQAHAVKVREIIPILAIITIHVHHYVLCLLGSWVKGCTPMTYLDGTYSFHSHYHSHSLLWAPWVCVYVCVCACMHAFERECLPLPF